MGEAGNQSGFYGIRDPRDDDGRRRGGPFRGEGSLGIDRDDHVDLEAHQFLREVAEGLIAGSGESPFDRNIAAVLRSEEHTSELQSLRHLVCRLLLEKKKKY